ncbi:MAG: site-2 protease family protein [bacterium]|nr:site-2 protease family protein [bacterium]
MEQVIQDIALMLVPMLFAVSFHEAAHGYVADRLGDPTARLAGRLTLNPFKHLDLVGTIVFVVTRMIGWAKPVPVNPFNLRDPKRDMMWVSLAGPGSNLVLAIISAMLLRLLAWYDPSLPLQTQFPKFASSSSFFLVPLFLMIQISVVMNIALAVFNCLPIPPLDGSKILMGLLPLDKAQAFARIEPYGFIILLGLIIFPGLLGIPSIVDILISPLINLVIRLLL